MKLLLGKGKSLKGWDDSLQMHKRYFKYLIILVIILILIIASLATFLITRKGILPKSEEVVFEPMSSDDGKLILTSIPVLEFKL